MKSRSTPVTAPPRYQTLNVQRQADVFFVRFVNSSLDEAWVHRTNDELTALVEQEGCLKLVVSLDQVECLYSNLLSMLLKTLRLLQGRNGRMKLIDVSPHAWNVFRVCKMEDLFEFDTDKEKALRDW